MKKFALLITTIIGFLFFSVEVYAACTGSSPTWTSTPDYASVNSCVGSASQEDTINVSAGDGTETWSSTLSISKGVSIIGPGSTNLTITCGANPCILYSPSFDYSLNYLFRISGFKFDGGGSNRPISITVDLDGEDSFPNKIRIDNNHFYNNDCITSGCLGAIRAQSAAGVIDNNTFEDIEKLPTRIGFGDPTNDGEDDWDLLGIYSYGTADVLYVEDNVFIDSGLDSGTQLFTDSYYAGQYVFRYNTFTSSRSDYCSAWDQHGGEAGGAYSFRGSEIYGNNITTGSTCADRISAVRGGKSMVFYNNWNASSDSSVINVYSHTGCPPAGSWYEAQFVNDTYSFGNRHNYTGSIVGNISVTSWDCAPTPAEGTDFWDDTTNSGVRKGTLASIPGTCAIGQGYWATDQSTSDLTDYVGADPTTPISGTLYKCSTINNWTEYYTPYTYPHPLREGDITPPEISGNPVIGTDGETVTITFSETVVTTGYDNGDFDLDCTLEGDGVDLESISGSGATRTFTAASLIDATDTCTLDYTGGADEIEDTAGNDLETFTDDNVTNTSEVDEIVPVLSNPLPSGDQACSSNPRDVVISIDCADATGCTACKAHLSDVDIDSMSITLSNDAGTWSDTIADRPCDASYTYFAKCEDAADNESAATEISFIILDIEINIFSGNLNISSGTVTIP